MAALLHASADVATRALGGGVDRLTDSLSCDLQASDRILDDRQVLLRNVRAALCDFALHRLELLRSKHGTEFGECLLRRVEQTFRLVAGLDEQAAHGVF